MGELLKIWPNGKIDKVFTKIFKLNPYNVECFIRDIIIAKCKRDCANGDISWLEDYNLEIKWEVPYNEFYVFLDPILETEDYKVFNFKDMKNLTAGEYFNLTNEHWHFSFQEIYGKMTGETVFMYESSVPDQRIMKALHFMYKEEEVDVYYNEDREWYINFFLDEAKECIKKPVPEDLLKAAIKIASGNRA